MSDWRYAPDKGSLAATGANVEVVERDPSLNTENIVTVNGRDEFTSRVADEMETTTYRLGVLMPVPMI